MSHARETTLFDDFLKNLSIMPLRVFLVFEKGSKFIPFWSIPLSRVVEL